MESKQNTTADPIEIEKSILNNIGLQVMNLNTHVKLLGIKSEDGKAIVNAVTSYMVKLQEYIFSNVEKMQK